jgi:hypothetical protein
VLLSFPDSVDTLPEEDSLEDVEVTSELVPFDATPVEESTTWLGTALPPPVE